MQPWQQVSQCEADVCCGSLVTAVLSSESSLYTLSTSDAEQQLICDLISLTLAAIRFDVRVKVFLI